MKARTKNKAEEGASTKANQKVTIDLTGEVQPVVFSVPPSPL